MKPQNGKIHRINMMEFFRRRVQDGLEHHNIETSEMAEFYLVNLLEEYHEASKLFSMEGDGPVMQPLALMLKEAAEGDELKQRQSLKRLGDTALYVAGFFTDYIHRSLVNLDYYISMGGSAYGTLSSMSKQITMRDLFYELAIKFGALVGVLAEISPWSQHMDNRRLVQIYSNWLESGDERLKDILEREGIDTSEEQHEIMRNA